MFKSFLDINTEMLCEMSHIMIFKALIFGRERLLKAGSTPTYLSSLLHHYAHLIFLSFQQDSLLASPIILDLVILTELCQRVTVRPQGEQDFQSFHSVLALLSFLCKAPLVPSGTPIVNAFFRQRACIENILRYG